VAEYVKRAEAAGLSSPLPADLDDTELERKLFPPMVVIPSAQRAVPDWSVVHEESKRKGVTLALLWDEYKAANP
jgi:transposase